MRVALFATFFGISNAFVPSNSDLVGRQLVSIRQSADENESFAKNSDALPNEVEPVRTIGGGADMIFEMARQMLLWDETGEDSSAYPSGQQRQQKKPMEPTVKAKKRPFVLPRWRPIRGVSDANPSFRTTAPMMNSQGYAGR